MHYIFVDEAYHDHDDSRDIVVAAWAVEQQLLNDRLRVMSQLRQRGNSPILARIISAFESLDGFAVVARANLSKSVFRPRETDGTDDVPAMARTDNVWSMSVIFTVGGLIRHLGAKGQDVGTVDIYYDRRDLKPRHTAAIEGTLRNLLVSEARRFGAERGMRHFKNLAIRRIEKVGKPKNHTPTRFQDGTWISDRLCANLEQVIAGGGMSRIVVADMSDEVRRTIQQFDGKSFYE
jgi:hypothetical protein